MFFDVLSGDTHGLLFIIYCMRYIYFTGLNFPDRMVGLLLYLLPVLFDILVLLYGIYLWNAGSKLLWINACFSSLCFTENNFTLCRSSASLLGKYF